MPEATELKQATGTQYDMTPRTRMVRVPGIYRDDIARQVETVPVGCRDCDKYCNAHKVVMGIPPRPAAGKSELGRNLCDQEENRFTSMQWDDDSIAEIEDSTTLSKLATAYGARCLTAFELINNLFRPRYGRRSARSGLQCDTDESCDRATWPSPSADALQLTEGKTVWRPGFASL